MKTSTDPFTLRSVLLSPATKLSEQVLAGLDVAQEAAEIKASLENAMPGLPLRPVIEGVCRSLEQALDVPIATMLARAWDRSRELRAAMQQTRDSESASVLVPLLLHTITSEHRPYVDVVLNETPVARLVFPLKVAFQLDGIVLRVAHGRIAQVLAGAVKIKATLKFADFVLLERTTPPITIPGSLTLETRAAAA
jgi:hypothetical protein